MLKVTESEVLCVLNLPAQAKPRLFIVHVTCTPFLLLICASSVLIKTALEFAQQL